MSFLLSPRLSAIALSIFDFHSPSLYCDVSQVLLAFAVSLTGLTTHTLISSSLKGVDANTREAGAGPWPCSLELSALAEDSESTLLNISSDRIVCMIDEGAHSLRQYGTNVVRCPREIIPYCHS